MDLILISAVGLDGAIGYNNKLLWHLPEDLRRFKTLTTNQTVIVGLNTFKSLPEKAKLNRQYIVIVGEESALNEEFEANITILKTPSDVIKYLQMAEIKSAFVAGGQMVYETMIDYCNYALITWIGKTYPYADKHFPINKLNTMFELLEDGEWFESDDLTYKYNRYGRIN